MTMEMTMNDKMSKEDKAKDMFAKALVLYSQVDRTTYSMDQMNETQRRLAFQQFRPRHEGTSHARSLFGAINDPDTHGRKILMDHIMDAASPGEVFAKERMFRKLDTPQKRYFQISFDNSYMFGTFDKSKSIRHFNTQFRFSAVDGEWVVLKEKLEDGQFAYGSSKQTVHLAKRVTVRGSDAVMQYMNDKHADALRSVWLDCLKWPHIVYTSEEWKWYVGEQEISERAKDNLLIFIGGEHAYMKELKNIERNLQIMKANQHDIPSTNNFLDEIHFRMIELRLRKFEKILRFDLFEINMGKPRAIKYREYVSDEAYAPQIISDQEKLSPPNIDIIESILKVIAGQEEEGVRWSDLIWRRCHRFYIAPADASGFTHLLVAELHDRAEPQIPDLPRATGREFRENVGTYSIFSLRSAQMNLQKVLSKGRRIKQIETTDTLVCVLQIFMDEREVIWHKTKLLDGQREEQRPLTKFRYLKAVNAPTGKYLIYFDSNDEHVDMYLDKSPAITDDLHQAIIFKLALQMEREFIQILDKIIKDGLYHAIWQPIEFSMRFTHSRIL